MRELHHPLLVAALRDDDPDLALRLLPQPLLEDRRIGNGHRHMNLRRRLLIGVVLLDRGFNDLAVRFGLSVLSLMRPVPDEFDALDHPPTTDDEDVDDGAAGADVDAEHITIAEFG